MLGKSVALRIQWIVIDLAPVVQMLDSVIHQIKIHPVDNAIILIHWRVIYPVDSAIQCLSNQGLVDSIIHLLNNLGQDPVVETLDRTIHWIETYPVDSVIHLLKNWARVPTDKVFTESLLTEHLTQDKILVPLKERL